MAASECEIGTEAGQSRAEEEYGLPGLEHDTGERRTRQQQGLRREGEPGNVVVSSKSIAVALDYCSKARGRAQLASMALSGWVNVDAVFCPRITCEHMLICRVHTLAGQRLQPSSGIDQGDTARGLGRKCKNTNNAT